MNQRRGAGSMAKALALTLFALSLTAQADTKVLITSYEYDATGLLTKQVVEPDSANDCLQTTYSYDVFGNRATSSSSTCAGATGYTVSSAAMPRTRSDGYGTDGLRLQRLR